MLGRRPDRRTGRSRAFIVIAGIAFACLASTGEGGEPESAGNGAPHHTSEVRSWRDEAHKNLLTLDLDGGLIALDRALLFGGAGWRCPRLNNYWCLKTRSGSAWPGSLGHDEEGHAAFVSAEYGAAAMVRLMRVYYTRLGKRSLADIVCRFAPESDCAGASHARRPVAHCAANSRGCALYTESLAQSLSLCADCDTQLFHADGRPTENLATLMLHMASYEISHPEWNVEVYPLRELLEAGIALERVLP